MEQLRAAGVDVMVEQDISEPHTPDSIIPNNWVSFHHDGTVVLYPMEAPNRRLERNDNILQQIKKQFEIRQIHDLSSFELKDQFLEGTGSLVLDREHRIAYVCRSSRSDPEVMREFSRQLDYQAYWFHAQDANGRDIYHTNVMMSVGRTLAVVCLEAIRDAKERDELIRLLSNTGKVIFLIYHWRKPLRSLETCWNCRMPGGACAGYVTTRLEFANYRSANVINTACKTGCCTVGNDRNIRWRRRALHDCRNTSATVSGRCSPYSLTLSGVTAAMVSCYQISSLMVKINNSGSFWFMQICHPMIYSY